MKSLLLAAAAAGMVLAALPQPIEAAERGARSNLGRSDRVDRQFSRRDNDRLPIRITRPPNTGHYIHQDYPLWAARAFQPTRSR